MTTSLQTQSSQTQSSSLSSSTFSFGTATSILSSSQFSSPTPSSTGLPFGTTAAFGSSAGPSTSLSSGGGSQPPSTPLFGVSTTTPGFAMPAFGIRKTAAPAGGGSSLSGSTSAALAVSNAAPAFSMPLFGAAAAASTTVTASPGFSTSNLLVTPSSVASTTSTAAPFSSMPTAASCSSPINTTTTSTVSFGTGSALSNTTASFTQPTVPASVAPAATSTSTTTTKSPVVSASRATATPATTTKAVSTAAVSRPAPAKPMSIKGPVLSARMATATPATTTTPVMTGALSIPAPTKPITTGFVSKAITTTPASPAQGLLSSRAGLAAISVGSRLSITTPKREPELVVLKGVGQKWAIYDDLDHMPRKYVCINKVYSPFKVDVTWLEFIAGDINETAWKRSGLPVACGKFRYNKNQKTDTITAMSSFSHKIFKKKSVGESCNIYPRKGETWALYKNWNIKWSSNPDNHRKYEYEYVVVLSDYTKYSGILVSHLVKLKGFVSLFKPTNNNGMASFQIPSDQMLRLSHRVPSNRTNGEERKDVPEGYFELDPCCLPSNLEEVSEFIDRKAEVVDDNNNGSSISVSKDKHPMLKKRKNPDTEITLDGNSRGGSKTSRMSDGCHNFRNKCKSSFVVGQKWAVFDNLDHMPRKYVQINKVYSPFKVDVTWLEFIAGDINETAWKRSGLPVACGKFRYGNNQKTDTITDMSSFSHKIFRKKSVSESCNIYPRKGETWALYKNWNIKWSSDPDNHRKYEYEFVVVLSDYTNKSGISVAHLVKLKGFVSLFKPTNNNAMASFQIPSSEMLRLSHRIPSNRTNGKERKDVPEGYFELDLCCLPSNLEEVSEFIDRKAEVVDGNNNGSSISLSKVTHSMLNKRKNPDTEITLDGSSRGGNKTSRISDGCYKNPNEENRAAEASCQPPNKSKATSVSDGEKIVGAHAKEMGPDGVNTIPGSVDKVIPSSLSFLKIFESLDTEFCNFDKERSCEKFKPGQVWALYCKLDKLPKSYVQIEYVESFPVFKLSAKLLKSCDPPRHIIPWVDKEMPVSCGTFKVTSSVVFFYDSLFFSHQVSGVPTANNVYTILPRAGEVWAVYSKFRSDLTCSDLKKCEYDIVEILEVVDVHWIIVSVLGRVGGFKAIFKAKQKEGLDSTAAIPWIDLYRFSHQVPSFMISGARYGKLRGCWELDIRSLAAADRPLDKSKATSVPNCDENVVAPTKKICLDGVVSIPGNVGEDIPSSPSSLKTIKMPVTKFCNFDVVRSCEMFKTGQIWALYSKLDKLPKTYAQIESFKSFPGFKLVVKLLKSCDPPRNIIPWVDKEMPVSCGTFKVTSNDVVVFKDSISFSHQLSKVPAVNNVYTIYPKAGEVWALYRKFRSDLTCSDLKKCEYDIVEILEVVDVHWIIVSVLQRVAGFKTIFKAKEKEGLDSTAAIPGLELYRFSHQVPSFILSGARCGQLRGCWELDPRSLAVCRYSMN